LHPFEQLNPVERLQLLWREYLTNVIDAEEDNSVSGAFRPVSEAISLTKETGAVAEHGAGSLHCVVEITKHHLTRRIQVRCYS